MIGRRLITQVVALLVLAAAGYGVYLAVLAGDAYLAVEFTVGAAIGLALLGLGLAVTARAPRNVVGLLLVCTGAVAVAIGIGEVYPAALVQQPDLPLSAVYVDLTRGDWMLLYVPPALLFLLVPDGRLPGRNWRWVVAGLLVVPALFLASAALDPTPLPHYPQVPKAFRAPEAVVDAVTTAAVALLPIFLGLLIAALVSIVARYRRTPDTVGRAQLRWFVVGASFLPLTLLLCWASYLMLDGPDLVVFGLLATYIAIPVATAIAVLKHDLYDVDRVLSATATYGLATAILLSFYTAATFVVGIGAGQGSAIAAAAATAVCATALAPMRKRLQRLVDRRLYPLRQAALAAIDDLRRGTDAGRARPEQLEAVLRAALRDPSLRVGYRLPGSAIMVDATNQPVEPVLAGSTLVPVRLAGSDIGTITAAGGVSRELLREVAAASSLLVEVVRLRAEVTSALAAVEESRARLLTAGYEERRRLERDLHDGAQQRLVTLGMRLRVAQRHLDDNSVDVDELLDTSVTELATAVAELRQIAHGLRPSSLDDGLDRALGALVGQLPIPVNLDVQAEPIPDHLATTAYYVASEAVTNAVKHARPSAIGVLVRREAQTLTIRVCDDGAGGAAARPGSGLGGLADRVAAAGGRLNLSSPDGGGTTVEAVLPCGS